MNISDKTEAMEMFGLEDKTNPFNENPKDMPKGWKTRVTNLTPKQYIDFVSNMSGTTPEKLSNWKRTHKDKNSVEELSNLIKSGKKLDMPWMIITNKDGTNPYFQEGLHRMLAVSDVYGENHKVPVTIGTERKNNYSNLENMNLDDFKNERNKQIQKYNDKEAKRKLKEKEQEIEDVADYYSINKEDVNDDLIKKYYKEMDEIFMI